MSRFAALVCSLLLVGCGDDRPRGERASDPLWWTGGPQVSRPQRDLAELRRLRDRACACTDVGCSWAVADQLTPLMAGFSEVPPELEAEVGALHDDLYRCFRQVDRAAADDYLVDDDDDDDDDDLQLAIPDPPPPDPGAPSATGVPECDQYVDAVRRFARCSKLPQATRDSLEDSLETMTQVWSGPGTLPPDTRQMMAEACVQGADAMQQSARAMGCP